MFEFYFVKNGCIVTQNSKSKKTFPSEIVFNFNFDHRLIPYHGMNMFSGDFYIYGVKINNSTTFSDFDALKNEYTLKNGSIDFGNCRITFEEKLKNPKIISITYYLL